MAHFAALHEKQLRRHVRRGDGRRYGIDLGAGLDPLVQQISSRAVDGQIDISTFHETRINRKPCVSYRDFECTLVLRAVAAAVRRRYRVVLPNRDRIVRAVIASMLDAAPYHVIRRDFRSFYETIPTEALKERLVRDRALSSATRSYIGHYFETHCRGGRGVPRGVGLSTVLAELFMERFDKKVREIPGVYRYFRYSDDILIFCFGDPSVIASELDQIIPDGMAFNPNRSKHYTETFDQSSGAPGMRSIDFLGYRLTAASPWKQKKDPRSVTVDIARRKTAKIKTRIILSLRQFQLDNDVDLLIDRLRFLASNYCVDRQGVTHRHDEGVRGGVFFNYRLCGRHGPDHEVLLPTALKELDAFLGYLVASRKSEFYSRISMRNGLRDKLLRIRFTAGFSKRMFVRFKWDRMTEIRAAWRNE